MSYGWQIKYPLYLASSSPRRKYLLSLLDVPFKVIKPEGVTEYEPKERVSEPGKVALGNAIAKAKVVVDSLEKPCLVLGADTIVYLPDEERILFKPNNAEEAVEMLKTLSGRVHIVYTAVVLIGPYMDSYKQTIEMAHVEFQPLTMPEIEYYVESYKPLDKAGAYGAQDWIGAVALKKINGSFYTVMGLPVHTVWQFLKDFILSKTAPSDNAAKTTTYFSTNT